MKFGRILKASLYHEWEPYYVYAKDYGRLKKLLKSSDESSYWSPQMEATFKDCLREQLEKVNAFQAKKIKTLTETLERYEKEVMGLSACTPRSSSPSTPQLSALSPPMLDMMSVPGNDQRPIEYDSDNDDDALSQYSVDGLEERFKELEHEVATLVADVHDIALYTKLNYSAAFKIIKKHDKQKPTKLQDYLGQLLESSPFYKQNYDEMIIRLSRVYDLIRTRGHPIEGDSSAGGSQSAFVRQTTKYWVHPDNLIPLKLYILKHLPVLVFNAQKPYEESDSAVSSIYFDNEELDLYLGRLDKCEGAQAIRLRWYGGMDVNQIFIERKTHHEDWTGEKSVKARFAIKEDKVHDFLSGRWTMSETFATMRAKGKKSNKEIDSMELLSKQVQQAIVARKLVPVMRTYYSRTAFQLPGDARVRISLDCDLTMIREDNWGKDRCGNDWRRKDAGIDWPFPNVESTDKHLFPYGVLEVKLQTQMGQLPPEWVNKLIASHLVEAVPKFSKFIHGVASLLPDRAALIPFWLPQMETSILKPITVDLDVAMRPMFSRPNSRPNSRPGSRSNSRPHSRVGSIHSPPLPDFVCTDQNKSSKKTPHDEELRMGLPESYIEAAVEAKRTREARRISEKLDSKIIKASTSFNSDLANSSNQSGQEFMTEAGRSAMSQISPLSSSSFFDSRFKDMLLSLFQHKGNNGICLLPECEAENSGTEFDLEDNRARSSVKILVSNCRAPAGKLVSVPIRLEPKVYFANERTFLKWLEFSSMLSTIAIGMVSFSHDDIGLISAGFFTISSLFAIGYSCKTFVWRAMRIRAREAAEYHDIYGPTMLCALVFASILLNFWLRLTYNGDEIDVKAWLNSTGS